WSFLVNRFSFQYTPSCRQWAEKIVKRTAEPTDRFGGFSWDPALDLDSNSTITWSEMARDGKIQFTRQQLDVVNLGSTLDGDLFLGPEATLPNFLHKVNDYQIVHLALPWQNKNSHLDWEEGVQFSAADSSALSMRSISGLSLQNDLILFSGFPKEVSEKAPGYDQLLPYAFHLSGAKAVINANWEAPTGARVDLLSRFFSYAKAGLSSAQALQAAKQDFIRQADLPELAHPYYWAAPVLHGHSANLDLQDENHDLLQIGLGLGGLALLILLIHILGDRLRNRWKR
ncbi:MAG: CHAT domain-containing protein, partial [Bacteroidota bacterium]